MTINSASLLPLTAIRGLAALWVYLYHRSNMTSGNAFFTAFAKDGYFGLDIFFILSGFIISYVHFDEFSKPQDVQKNIGRFLLLRLCRIYPLHILMLFAFVNLQAPSGGVGDFLQHVLLMQSWGWSNNGIWNIPAWSISVEWLIYLLFPLFACGIFAMARSAVFNIGMIVAALGLWKVYLVTVDQSIHDLVQPMTCLPRGILNFVIGVALHNLYRQKFLEKLPWDAIAVAATLGIAGASWARAINMQVHDILMIALFTLLIYALTNIRGWANVVFSNRVVVYLGTISYSLYMLQWFYLLLIAKYRGIQFAGEPFFDWHFFAETLGLIAVSALSYHCLEHPARKWIRAQMEEEKA
ncbi:MAG: acyltransferase family protein [Alphaproteobacteria bacterium]